MKKLIVPTTLATFCIAGASTFLAAGPFAELEYQARANPGFQCEEIKDYEPLAPTFNVNPWNPLDWFKESQARSLDWVAEHYLNNHCG